jgi:hypothetical protein
MSRICGCCGQPVDNIPRYFMCHVPDSYISKKAELTFDDKFTCRGGDQDYFISCEVELPFNEGREDPLGFIGWVQVSSATYNAYRDYRTSTRNLPPYEELVPGRMANPIPEAPDTLGVAVKFRVLPSDPTPYIRWAEPNTPARRAHGAGATIEFWHRLASRFLASH